MDVTGTLAGFIESALERSLPAETTERACHHILDSIAASASGSQLAAGVAGASYARAHSTSGPAVVIAGSHRCAPAHAALANAMAAHADETDDSSFFSRTHPGASIVPAALARAEVGGRTGRDLVRAVTVGYDVGCRVTPALWPDFATLRKVGHSTHGIGGMFGSAAAAAALAGLESHRIRQLLSYVAQQVSGTLSWRRDVDHVEKAYVFSGHPAHGALFALSLIENGWTGVHDVFVGEPNFLDIVGQDPDPQLLVAELGSRYEIDRTNIKRYSVGSPAQAPVQGLVQILREEGLKGEDVRSVTVRLPSLIGGTVVADRDMPDINLSYLLSAVLADGDLSFAAAHDERRFAEWRSGGGDPRVELALDDSMEAKRQAIVEVTTTADTSHRAHVKAVRGTYADPMTTPEVLEKAVDLMAPVYGAPRAREISETVLGLDAVDDLGPLSALLASAA